MEINVARHRSLVILCSTLSFIAGGLIGFFTPHPQSYALAVVTPEPTATPSPTATPAPLRVYVSGAVRTPAVYRLPPGSLVEDALLAAGGATADADLERINLAQELSDQQQVNVPRVGEGSAPAIPSAGVEPTALPLININTATADELETLSGIGPATAQQVVDYRQTFGPFESIEELLDVPGIGTATFEGIREYITTE